MLGNLPKSVTDKIFPTIEHMYHRQTGFALVVDKLSGNQLSYDLLNQLYNYKNPYNDVCIFNFSNDLPIIQPDTTVYPLLSINAYTGPIIFTSPGVIPYYRMLNNAKPYYYAYDVNMIKFLNPPLKAMLGNFTIISRGKEQSEFLKALNLKPHPVVVPNFNYDIFEQIVKE